jgi:hypothetical protein
VAELLGSKIRLYPPVMARGEGEGEGGGERWVNARAEEVQLFSAVASQLSVLRHSPIEHSSAPTATVGPPQTPQASSVLRQQSPLASVMDPSGQHTPWVSTTLRQHVPSTSTRPPGHGADACRTGMSQPRPAQAGLHLHVPLLQLKRGC